MCVVIDFRQDLEIPYDMTRVTIDIGKVAYKFFLIILFEQNYF